MNDHFRVYAPLLGALCIACAIPSAWAQEQAQEKLLTDRYKDAKLVVGPEKSADIDRQNRLRDLIVTQFAESRKALTASKDQAATKAATDDNAPINMGFSPGPIQGVSMMGSRINKGAVMLIRCAFQTCFGDTQ